LSKHERFKEFCALAAIGELTPDYSSELDLHLADCEECRQVYREYIAIHSTTDPTTSAEQEALIERHRGSTKAAVLRNIAAVDAANCVNPEEMTSTAIRVARPSYRRPLRVWAGALAVSAAVILFWLGMSYEKKILHRDEATRNASQPNQGVQPSGATASLSGNEFQLRSLQLQAERANAALDAEKEHDLTLTATLAQKNERLLQVERDRSILQAEIEAKTAELNQTRSLLTAKTDELKETEAAKSADNTTLVALRYQVQDLTEKLNDQKESLDRERQLLAGGREIRDIIGARNLHIIDVYDTAPDGNTKKSFARAFYTEGKSLIFYAYDLPARHTEDGKYVYAAWGQSNGNKNMVRNLGILLNDDKGQKRWVLNFSDPKVLAEVDSVFITLERVGEDRSQPSGKRMLTAYLYSQVNHP
jgi:hypothetical protein